MMENFLTWEMLLTYSGCVAGTVLLTEFMKKLFPKLMPQLVSFVLAAVILSCGHWATGTFAVAELPLYLVNAVAVSLAANGGFDILKKAFGGAAAEGTDVQELIVDASGEEGVYLTFASDPTELKDGQTLTFRVKKVSQE